MQEFVSATILSPGTCNQFGTAAGGNTYGLGATLPSGMYLSLTTAAGTPVTGTVTVTGHWLN